MLYYHVVYIDSSLCYTTMLFTLIHLYSHSHLVSVITMLYYHVVYIDSSLFTFPPCECVATCDNCYREHCVERARAREDMTSEDRNGTLYTTVVWN